MPDPYGQVHISGKALRSARLAADLSLEQLASDAGLPQVRLQALEALRSAPVDHRVVRRLIEVFGCDFYDLFTITESCLNGV